jgi:phosphoribosylformimino-5-aminoimidazole carboxamide ribotide isomerase
MIPIPAIDLKGGKVVRLLHGDFKEEKIYFDEPLEIARRFEADGASRIHVVDLDGALKGEPKNLGAIEKILKGVRTPVEVGGGIRSLDTAARYFEMGARWAVFGTKACLDPGFLREAIGEFGAKAIVGIDARDGFLATDGWTRVTQEKAVDFAKKVESLGGRTVIYTDISKDGALGGPNLAGVRALCEAVRIGVVASGGVGSAHDVEALARLQLKNLEGVIIGKAIYEGKITLKEALSASAGRA